MRVLIADKFEQSGLDGLQSAGAEVSYKPGLKDDALAQEVRRCQPDVLVVRSTKVTDAILSAGPLKLVVRAGAGYNTIDVAAASRRGIYVSNCPGKNSVAVAELAFGLICALDRRLADNVIALRQGQWNKSEFSKARGLFGRTLGLIGVGRIGREMIPRAQAFGMPVVAWSRSLTPQRARELGIEYKPFPLEVAKSADIVSVHLAANADTRGFINAGFFAAMRRGSYFINTSRAEVIDQAALAAAVENNGLRAGLDVFAAEPAGGAAAFTDDIVKLAAVYGTHHIGASTDQAQEAIAAETVRIIRTFQVTGKVPNVVNLATATPATFALVVRHLDHPGVLASVLDLISAARINVQEMENVIFEGAQAAVARIHLETAPDPELLDKIRQSTADILELSMIRLEQHAAA
jgi:D-3-phosphoglycerate dehydrogenase / 2-oxoglutarate reductase